MSHKAFKAKTVIFREGDVGKKMYILLRGKVQVLQRGQPLEILDGKGGIFGEVAMMTKEPRAATVCTLTPVECLVAEDWEGISDFLQDNPSMAIHMAGVLAKRLAATNQKLAQAVNENVKLKSALQQTAKQLELLKINRVALDDEDDTIEVPAEKTKSKAKRGRQADTTDTSTSKPKPKTKSKPKSKPKAVESTPMMVSDDSNLEDLEFDEDDMLAGLEDQASAEALEHGTDEPEADEAPAHDDFPSADIPDDLEGEDIPDHAGDAGSFADMQRESAESDGDTAASIGNIEVSGDMDPKRLLEQLTQTELFRRMLRIYVREIGDFFTVDEVAERLHCPRNRMLHAIRTLAEAELIHWEEEDISGYWMLSGKDIWEVIHDWGQ